MEYMLLIHADETKREPPPNELQKLMDAYGQFTEGIVKSGHLREAGWLAPSTQAKTVRANDLKTMATSGPCTSATIQLAGYYVVECETIAQAIEIAGRIPGIRLGEPVEVRPLAPRHLPERTS